MAEDGSALFLFEKQVVSGRVVIKPISLNFIRHLIGVHAVVVLERFQDFFVYGNRILTDDNRRSVGRLMLNLVVPRVCTDVLDSEAVFRLWVEDHRDQVLALG